MSLSERATADLIYRDNNRIKHRQSQRLEDEIHAKAQALPGPTSVPSVTDHEKPLTKAFIDHLRDVSIGQKGNEIFFAAEKCWISNMVSPMQSSFGLRDNADQAAISDLGEWIATLDDEAPAISASSDRQMQIIPARPSGARAFSFMAGASAAQVSSVTQTSTAIGSSQLTHADNRFFFTVVSENMNSYTLLGTQAAKFDLMIHQYLPAEANPTDDGLTLVPYGMPLTLQMKDQSFESLAQSCSVWQSQGSDYILFGSDIQLSRMPFGKSLNRFERE